MQNDIIKKIAQILPKERIKENEVLKEHTTFRVGGTCKAMLLIESLDELRQLLQLFREFKESYFVLGNGSNLVVADAGYEGYILQLHNDKEIEIDVEQRKIIAGAGMKMAVLAKEAAKSNLSGLAFAAGIPGTIGGGVIMNAGAYGGELKQVVAEVLFMTSDGEIHRYSNQDMDFGYRNSSLKNTDAVIWSVEFQLEQGQEEIICQQMKEMARKRIEKQPLEFPSAGSTFKRPEGYFAGKLIEDAGLRGYSVGGAQVSEKHCGFVINRNQATAQDIKRLIQDVQQAVYEKYKVKLEREVIYLGEDKA